MKPLVCYSNTVCLGLYLFFAASTPTYSQDTPPTTTEPKYQPTWESLATHKPAPDWFRDAKLGIYFHWGVYSVPAFGSEWYPRNMHLTERKENKHHLEKYGDPAEFGYDRFVPDFKAEKFDADQWCDLFQKAGAKFVGPVSEHHDGYAMWDSDLTQWNSMDTGPKRDITGEMAAAARARGMKVITTFHHARNNLWQKEKDGAMVWTGHYEGAKTNYPTALDDPNRAFLYGYMPRGQFLKLWVDKLKEVIDNYQPDIIWFDSWLDEIPDQQKMEFLAHYLNSAEGNDQEVVVLQTKRPAANGRRAGYRKGRHGLADRIRVADRRHDQLWQLVFHRQFAHQAHERGIAQPD